MEDEEKKLQVAKKDNSDLQIKEPYGELESNGKVKIRSARKASGFQEGANRNTEYYRRKACFL